MMNKPIINNDVIPPIRSGSLHLLCLSIFIFALIIALIPNIAIAKIGKASMKRERFLVGGILFRTAEDVRSISTP